MSSTTSAADKAYAQSGELCLMAVPDACTRHVSFTGALRRMAHQHWLVAKLSTLGLIAVLLMVLHHHGCPLVCAAFDGDFIEPC